jgi:4-alpha-glucanotransferase
MSEAPRVRQAGLVVPLASCPSTASWGVGDIGDLVPMASWLSGGGQQLWQLLPLNEMAPGQQSPYSALSAMAVDPLFICVPQVEEFVASGGEPSLGPVERELLETSRRSPRIDYARVRQLKSLVLRAAFERFYESEWRHDTTRARELKRFASEQAWWVEDYAIFRALHAHHAERPWTEWPAALQRREPADIDHVHRELAHDLLFRQYLQWLAWSQWQAAKQKVAQLARRVAVHGDLPFMVDGDSADVWALQHQFRLDATVGAPPDAFSETGQDWGMPLYRWDVMAMEQFLWLRARARRNADLYDGYRIDHLVGFYRTFAWPRDGGPPFFTPAAEPEQLALGELVLSIFKDSGATIIAEDLGVVPGFVRDSLARLGVPGFRVFRWEREWSVDGQPFRDPSTYPPVSVAASGTHDTETMAAWWEHALDEERQRVSELPTIQRLAAGGPVSRDVLLEALFASGSDTLLIPIQDVFGWQDRINEPGTVTDDNWTYRLPWPCDRLEDQPEARERQRALHNWASVHHRL